METNTIMSKELKTRICYHCDKNITGKEWIDAAGKKHSAAPKHENMAWCGKDCYARYMKTLASLKRLSGKGEAWTEETPEQASQRKYYERHAYNNPQSPPEITPDVESILDEAYNLLDSLWDITPEENRLVQSKVILQTAVGMVLSLPAPEPKGSLQHEQPLGIDGEVMFSGSSDLVAHSAHAQCPKEAPHDMSECGLCAPEPKGLTPEEVSNWIREIDGDHDKGAGEIGEYIFDRIKSHLSVETGGALVSAFRIGKTFGEVIKEREFIDSGTASLYTHDLSSLLSQFDEKKNQSSGSDAGLSWNEAINTCTEIVESLISFYQESAKMNSDKSRLSQTEERQ